MSIKEENLIQYSGTIKAGQRLVKVGNTFMPVGVGGAFEPGSGTADTSAFEAEMTTIIGEDANIPPVLVSGMKFYKCASVDTANKTWSGYELILLDGAYVVSDVLTENLKYTFITPMVESYYSEDGLLQLKDFYNGTVLVSPTSMTSDENDEWLLTASSVISNRTIYGAFNGLDNSDGWQSDHYTSPPQWIQWQNKKGKVKVTSYSLQASGEDPVNMTPQNWVLLGSDDGNSWVTVDTREGVISNATAFETFAFTCQNPGSYYYYRLQINAPFPSGYMAISQIKAYGQFE
jgi:hypothetical protein